ncbi:MAG TPA: hypothetical protein VF755_22560, partial [Catenuloplanes sp.]
MTRLFVDAWDPAYGASFEAGVGAPVAPSSAQVNPDVEVPAARWGPVGARSTVRCPEVVLLVDGVRRIDAGLWTQEDDGSSYPGLAASYAAGVVRCDLGRGVAEQAAQSALQTGDGNQVLRGPRILVRRGGEPGQSDQGQVGQLHRV